MRTNPHSALRAAGWSFALGHQAIRHPSGATVVPSLGLWRAKRANGEVRDGIVRRDMAAAWALGKDVAPAPEPPEPIAPKRAQAAPWVPAGRGVIRHARGHVESGGATQKYRAVLANGERRDWKLKADAKAWVEGGGVFRPGYVPAERRGE